MQSVMPNRYFFDLSFRSPKIASPIQVDGDLKEWNLLYAVPDVMHLDGKKPFADVYFSWDDDNLYIGLNVTDKNSPVKTDPERFWRGDCLELWIDLRNDKTRRVYSEHCHHFFLLPAGKRGNPEAAVAGEWRQPGSAIPETILDHPQIEVASVLGSYEYSLEARIPKSVIPTYDPVNYPVIGFNYNLNDLVGRRQWWNCGWDFSRHTDPSTWGSVRLMG